MTKREESKPRSRAQGYALQTGRRNLKNAGLSFSCGRKNLKTDLFRNYNVAFKLVKLVLLLFVFHCSVESAKDGSKKEEV